MVNVDEWMKSGKYLPKFLRDFHDQKDVFKAIHQTIILSDYCKDVSWVAGQCYVIDVFLWYMAKRGYTLQKTRKKGDYNDIDADVAEQTDRRRKASISAMKSMMV